MQRRKIGFLFSDRKLTANISELYRSLFNNSVPTQDVHAVISRMNEMYEELFNRDLKECEFRLRKLAPGEDASDLRNMITMLNHITKTVKFDHDDLKRLKVSKLEFALHITDFLKFRIETISYNKFIFEYLRSLKEMPTCTDNIRKILAKLDGKITIENLFTMFAEVIKEFNRPQIGFSDYVRDNKAMIASLHFNDVIAGKVKLPSPPSAAKTLRK